MCRQYDTGKDNQNDNCACLGDPPVPDRLYQSDLCRGTGQSEGQIASEGLRFKPLPAAFSQKENSSVIRIPVRREIPDHMLSLSVIRHGQQKLFCHGSVHFPVRSSSGKQCKELFP